MTWKGMNLSELQDGEQVSSPMRKCMQLKYTY